MALLTEITQLLKQIWCSQHLEKNRIQKRHNICNQTNASPPPSAEILISILVDAIQKDTSLHPCDIKHNAPHGTYDLQSSASHYL